jgi:hypothetical protein
LSYSTSFSSLNNHEYWFPYAAVFLSPALGSDPEWIAFSPRLGDNEHAD